MKGSYILVLWLDQPHAGLQIGRLGRFAFAPGCYLYVGSAFGSGGLRSRLAYHQRQAKARPHWHIDYLRAVTCLCEAWTVASDIRLECVWCKMLATHPEVNIPVHGFGSRDTGCAAHLFYLPRAGHDGRLTSTILREIMHQPEPVALEVQRCH